MEQTRLWPGVLKSLLYIQLFQCQVTLAVSHYCRKMELISTSQMLMVPTPYTTPLIWLKTLINSPRMIAWYSYYRTRGILHIARGVLYVIRDIVHITHGVLYVALGLVYITRVVLYITRGIFHITRVVIYVTRGIVYITRVVTYVTRCIVHTTRVVL